MPLHFTVKRFAVSSQILSLSLRSEQFYIYCQGTYKSPRLLQGTYPQQKYIIDRIDYINCERGLKISIFSGDYVVITSNECCECLTIVIDSCKVLPASAGQIYKQGLGSLNCQVLTAKAAQEKKYGFGSKSWQVLGADAAQKYKHGAGSKN